MIRKGKTLNLIELILTMLLMTIIVQKLIALPSEIIKCLELALKY